MSCYCPGGPCQLPSTPSFLKQAFAETQWPELPEDSSHKETLRSEALGPKAAEKQSCISDRTSKIVSSKKNLCFANLVLNPK